MASPRTIKHRLLRKSARWLIHAVILTCRIRTLGTRTIRELRQKGTPIIYAVWHRHLFVPIYMFKDSGVRPLISLSSDGEIVAQIAEEFGTRPVRGSSTQGGTRALLRLLHSIKRDHDELFITADGPKGPAKEVKDGIIVLAQKSGAAVIPVCWYADRVRVFTKTWDRFMIPKLFSHIWYAYGPPVIIPPGIHKTQYPQQRTVIKQSLDDLEQRLMSLAVRRIIHKPQKTT